MDKLKNFFMTSLIGGLLVLLPLAVLLFVLSWIFTFVTNLLQPITEVFLKSTEFPLLAAQALSVVVILFACFFIGLFLKTKVGSYLYHAFEKNVLKKAPGFTLIKDTIHQFFGSGKSPFGSVALCQIFENDSLVTGFITDELEGSDRVSVFIPTGPNPTSGFVYHLDRKWVHVIDISVEDAMRTIISCGAGSSKLIEKYQASSK